jgi:cell shape-determining protein MreD
MRQILILAGTVLMLFILQSLPAYRLNDMKLPVNLIRLQADIACILGVYLGVREKHLLRGTVTAVVVGLLANAFAPSAIRIYSFLAPIVFIITYAANQAFFFKRLGTYMLLTLVMTLVFDLAFFYLMATAGKWHGHTPHLLLPMFLQALLNGLMAAIIFTFFDWVCDYDESTATRRFRY